MIYNRCVECKSEVAVDSYKKVREAVDFVRKVEETKGRVSSSGSTASSSTTASATTTASSSSKSKQGKGGDPSSPSLPRPRGLSNLGNTCFFNSVMQSLARTHPLTAVMDGQARKGAEFRVPEVRVAPAPLPDSEGSFDDMEVEAAVEAKAMSREGAVLEAATLALPEPGPIALALTAFLKEMNSLGKIGVYNPGFLFGKVAARSPQFRGFHQQDAQELLRHLLEGLRSEETKRQKSAILKHFGLSERTDPKTVPWATRRKLQALNRHGSHTTVERVFGGHLVSTVVCEECHNSSQIFEPFLDLSLPLVEEKPQRPAPKKSGKVANNNNESGEEGEATNCCGKEMSKKEKRRMKKDKRRQSKKKQSLPEKEEESVKEEEKVEVKVEPVEEGAVDNREVEEQKDDDNEQEAVDAEQEEDEEEKKMRRELEENEKGRSSKSPPSDKESLKDSERLDNSRDSGLVASKLSVFDSKKDKRGKEAAQDGNEEDDEDDGYSEDEEGWEWDYGEEWEEGQGGEKKEEEEVKSVYLEVDAEEDSTTTKPKQEKLVSLNPLPPERLQRGSSERERSSEQTAADEGENSNDDSVGEASSVAGDVEDNVDELGGVSSKSFRPDPDHLDPHMEELCRKVRDVSVASVQVHTNNGGGGDFGVSPEDAANSSKYSVHVENEREGDEEGGAEKLRCV